MQNLESSSYTPKQRQKLPSDPGIYKFLNADGSILYIGKAKDLKKRVQSYFSSKHQESLKTKVLVAQIKQIQIITCKTEDDAYILESQLIKHFQPKYNIMLKDDKSYPYIKISKEPYPRLSMSRYKDKSGTFYGPFPYIGSMRKTLTMLHNLFPIRDCSQPISKTKKEPKCINVDIGRCIGPCIYKDKFDDYQKLVKSISLLLSGKNKELMNELYTQMKTLSDQKRYEEAATVRDIIQKLDQLQQKQPSYDIPLDKTVDCITLVTKKNLHYLLMHHYKEGRCLTQNGSYALIQEADIDSLITEGVSQWYSKQKTHPDELYCDAEIAPIIKTLFKGSSTKIKTPKIGPKTEIIEHAKRNAIVAINNIDITPKQNVNTLEQMQSVFGLSKLPRKIIGFDISHYYGSDIVASCVYFENGVPNKKMYRKIQIKSLTKGKSNDPASMLEAVERRLKLAIRQKEELPDLLLIDGGFTQLRASIIAKNKIPNSGQITCIALAKREEEFYTSPHHQDTIKLDQYHPVRLLCQHIRDEAHRYALSFQRKKRTQKWKDSPLHHIKGLGPKKIDALYKAFKTLENIANASIEEIGNLPYFNIQLAKVIKKTLGS